MTLWNPEHLIVAMGMCLVLSLGYFWMKDSGLWQGAGAILCRLLWMLPLAMSLFPAWENHSERKSPNSWKIPVLVDDSPSMDPALTRNALDTLTAWCRELPCELQPHPLSSLSPLVKEGYTPLAQAITPWSSGPASPWILLSDGGDMHPEALRTPAQVPRASEGLLVYVGEAAPPNLWIQDAKLPPYGFEYKPLEGSLTLGRSPVEGQASSQVQIFQGQELLSALPVRWAQGERSTTVQVIIPPLSKGAQTLRFELLPSRAERSTWDNTRTVPLQIITDTIGILHLLGQPSWEGRFLRQYLKSEPKFNVISFFILRDPTDSYIARDREMSLIPFPVEEIFGKSLNQFELLVLQDFDLNRFLQPRYLDNIRDYVLHGGKLLVWSQTPQELPPALSSLGGSPNVQVLEQPELYRKALGPAPESYRDTLDPVFEKLLENELHPKFVQTPVQATPMQPDTLVGPSPGLLESLARTQGATFAPSLQAPQAHRWLEAHAPSRDTQPSTEQPLSTPDPFWFLNRTPWILLALLGILGEVLLRRRLLA